MKPELDPESLGLGTAVEAEPDPEAPDWLRASSGFDTQRKSNPVLYCCSWLERDQTAVGLMDSHHGL